MWSRVPFTRDSQPSGRAHSARSRSPPHLEPGTGAAESGHPDPPLRIRDACQRIVRSVMAGFAAQLHFLCRRRRRRSGHGVRERRRHPRGEDSSFGLEARQRPAGCRVGAWRAGLSLAQEGKRRSSASTCRVAHRPPSGTARWYRGAGFSSLAGTRMLPTLSTAGLRSIWFRTPWDMPVSPPPADTSTPAPKIAPAVSSRCKPLWHLMSCHLDRLCLAKRLR